MPKRQLEVVINAVRCVKVLDRNGSIEMMLQFEGVWGLITKFVLLTLAVLLVWCQFGQSYLNQLLQKQERKLRSTSSIITGKYLWFVPGWFICTLLLDVDWVLVIGKLSQSKHWSAVWKSNVKPSITPTCCSDPKERRTG